jgi:hypothetical protein
MALSITDADIYISENVIDTEDWTDSDGERKQRLLNVASRTLLNRFKQFEIPDHAVYEFSAYLATVYNDTNKLQQYGVKQFSIKGIAFTFDGSLTKDLNALIPQIVYDLVGEANGVVLSKQRVGRSIR